MRSANYPRNHLQVLNEILDVCREPQVVTELLCTTGLSLSHLQFCLKHLLKQNLVRFHYRKRTYTTTEKGLRYLQLCAVIKKD